MNHIDFTTQPFGFPLTADKTMDFLQRCYVDAIKGLAGIAGDDQIVLSGCVDDGVNVTPGWVLLNGDVVYFEGGAIQSNYHIVTTAESAENESGVSVDRYFTKRAVFDAAATTYAYSLLKRVPTILEAVNIKYLAANKNRSLTKMVVLSGLVYNGSSAITSGVVLYQDKVINAPAYLGVVTAASPAYLKSDGEWVTTQPATGSYIKFDTDTPDRNEYVALRQMHDTGTVLWLPVSPFPSAHFEANGLGKHKYEGWAIADGSNGTNDLSTSITGLKPIQRI